MAVDRFSGTTTDAVAVKIITPMRTSPASNSVRSSVATLMMSPLAYLKAKTCPLSSLLPIENDWSIMNTNCTTSGHSHVVFEGDDVVMGFSRPKPFSNPSLSTVFSLKIFTAVVETVVVVVVVVVVVGVAVTVVVVLRVVVVVVVVVCVVVVVAVGVLVVVVVVVLVVVVVVVVVDQVVVVAVVVVLVDVVVEVLLLVVVVVVVVELVAFSFW